MEAAEDTRSLVQKIADLKEEQRRQREARKTVAKALKRSMRKKRSLQRQAQNLSREDLLAVILIREEKKRKKEFRPGSSSKDAAPEQQAGNESTGAMSCSQLPPQDSGNAGEPFAQAAPTDGACEPFAQAAT